MFKFLADEIGHRVANGSLPCDIFSKGAELPRCNDADIGPKTCYTLRRSTASIMKDLI